ncbi:hypothetical protein SLS53_004235 [Cytospora paraplurivora]|uniref:NB-ARC domain-containing protein n=1 Tax=Cytospora paraplurivora TaxID=2898453 RepID=A0AAN9YHS6_9PEZI
MAFPEDQGTEKAYRAFTASTNPTNGGPSSPIWQAALDRYFAELRRGGVKEALIEKDLWNVEDADDLLAQVSALAPTETASPWTRSVAQLKPILLGFSDFAAITAWAMGMDGRVAAVIWGSIRLMIKLAQPVLPELITMLEELQKTLPRFQRYERELPMTDSLEAALFDTYSDVVVFCAQSIAFFRNNPNVGRNRGAWSMFSRDFATTIARVRGHARRVDEVADMIRLSRETRTAETVEVMQGMKKMKLASLNVPCYNIPYGLNLRFFGREDQVKILRGLLDPSENHNAMRVVAIHGLGGVGKTQLALHYANTSLKLYEAIIWIPAETPIKIIQTISAFAVKLGLVDKNTEVDDYQAVQKLRDWLNVTEANFLLIFDNVEESDVLEQIWPASTNASVIITTRSPSVASRRSTNLLHLECFSNTPGAEVLCLLSGRQPTNDADVAAAAEITQLLGGLPLAIIQVSAFIRDRNCLYTEFLTLFHKSAQKVFARSKVPGEYGYTVETAWNMSIERLSPNAKVLLNVLAFFDPDLIPERLILETKANIDDEQLEFLFDEFDFGDAVMELTRASLVTRLATSMALSVHRLVQQAVFDRLSPAERIYYLDNVIQMLAYDFPNTWTGTGPSQGHGYKSWELCGAVLSHVGWLMALTKKHKLKPSDPNTWAELIFRAGTYLWEKEQPYLALSFFSAGLEIPFDQTGTSAAQAYRLLGHISLDIARPRAALTAYEKSLEIRRMLEEPDSPPIADVYDSIGCSYTEMGDVSQAFRYVEMATAIHNAHDPKRMARTDAIRAITCLRAQRPQNALEALQHCWQLQGLTQEQVAESKYPKHSGDIVLLGRIRWAQGDRIEARQLVSRTIGIRKGLFGNNGGPRVADSLFQLAIMLSADGELVLAAKLLRDVVDMGANATEMRAHNARALWFLAGAEEQLGADQEGVEALRDQARSRRAQIEDREYDDEDSDDGFMRLVSWMLW